jgi:hypothetical protein
MTPSLRHLCLSITAIAIFSAAAFAQHATPKAAVDSFYKFDRSHSQTFNRRNVEARKAWLSPELYRLFQNELSRQAAYLKQNPTDKPYFGDGFPFQPPDEVCAAGRKQLRRTLIIKQEFQRTKHAAATATFAYPRPCADREKLVYTIGLIKVKGSWVIDDVNYGEDTSLKERLKRTEY